MKSINIYSLRQVKEKSGLYDIGSKRIGMPQDVANTINTVLDLNNSDVEKFGILTLNTKNEIAGIHIISIGTINSSVVHPREVFKNALLNNACSVILFHNHPSGDPAPSEEDIEVTKRLVNAGNIMGIGVLDHIIVGDNTRYMSFKEDGII